MTVLLTFAGLVALGVWQVQRLQWKRELLADIASAQQASAIPLAEALEAVRRGEPVGFRRVVVNCPGLEQAGLIELHAIEDGVLGRRWISPCRLENAAYPAVLVDRGFVPDGVVPPPPPEGRGPRPVVGYLRQPEKVGPFTPPPSQDADGGMLWFRREVQAMSRPFGLEGRVAPVFLMLESPPPATGLPRPAPLPTRISNNHLGYAVTWFGLAAALLGVYAAMLRRPRNPA